MRLRRCPTTWPTLQRYWKQGDTPCTPGGAAPPAPRWGYGGGVCLPSAGRRGRDKMRLLDGWSCCGLRPPSAGGLAWPAPLSHRPTLQRFWKQGDSPCTPAGAAPPAPRLGNGVLIWLAPSFSGGTGLACAVVPPAHPPTFWKQGDTLYPRWGLRPLHPAWETDGAFFDCMRYCFFFSPGARSRGAVTEA